MLNVVCVKSKPFYDYKYVNRLQSMVKKNITVPYRFICFTDDSNGLKCHSVRTLPSGLEGWWAKLAIFKEGSLDGKVLYLDLDTLIVGNLDFVCSYEGDFAILRDFYRPDGYGSGVMLWNKNQPHIWDEWIKTRFQDPLGDQGWIEKTVKNADLLQDLFPDSFVSFKEHCLEAKPDTASVICFHGYPKPHELPENHWAVKTWKM